MMTFFRKTKYPIPDSTDSAKGTKESIHAYNDHDCKVILDALHSEYGLDFRKQVFVTTRKIERFCRQHTIYGFKELAQKIKVSQETKQALVNELTIGETYFNREFEQLKILAKMVHRGQVKSILSAPCSTGEEIYSLAIEIHMKDNMPNDTILHGIDVNTDVLQKAKIGCYSQRSVNRLSQSVLDRFFCKNEEKWCLSNSIRKNIRFFHKNIFDDTIKSMGPYDAIISRNMLIYFSDSDKRRAIRQFLSILKPGGYLFLGHADITYDPSGLLKIYDNAVTYFKKPI
jgi:chemotaxis protein methyltransferase CheR